MNYILSFTYTHKITCVGSWIMDIDSADILFLSVGYYTSIKQHHYVANKHLILAHYRRSKMKTVFKLQIAFTVNVYSKDVEYRGVKEMAKGVRWSN